VTSVDPPSEHLTSVTHTHNTHRHTHTDAHKTHSH